MKKRKFNDILNECLERVLNKGATVEQCLDAYPDYATELEPLLRTALAAQDAATTRPRPEFRERARYQFQAALREMAARKSPIHFSWQPRWAVAVISVVVLLLAGSSTVAAASSSLPDEPLYPVKMATEAVQLKLTFSDLGKAELYVKFADRRVAEIVKMAEKGNVAQVERITWYLNDQLVAVANLGLPGGEGSLMMAAPVPTTVPATATATMTAPTITLPPAAPSTATGKQHWDKMREKQEIRAKLREILEDSAAGNTEALQKALEKAPESVRDALRRALEDALANYEQAISNWDTGR
jgi:hypothetical protein